VVVAPLRRQLGCRDLPRRRFVRRDGLGERAQVAVLGHAFGERRVDPRAQRRRATGRDGLVGRFDQGSIYRDGHPLLPWAQ
jgi:hypothetical protein